ncbi:MAG: hypothetical protein AAB416_03785 [Patescibacteria group bacterium]|mgnify:FL=1
MRPGGGQGGVFPEGARGTGTAFAKQLTGSAETKFKTELAAGDYIYIPLMDALFIVENAPDDTHVNVIQVAGIKTAATPTFVPITPSADTKLDFKILKKGNVFRVERDLGIKRMDGTPQIAHDLIVDNRGIVNIGGGIAPPGESDLALYVTGKMKADGYCFGTDPVCVSRREDLNFWSKTADGTSIYPTVLTQKVGIGTNAPSQALTVVGNVSSTGFCLGTGPDACKTSWDQVGAQWKEAANGTGVSFTQKPEAATNPGFHVCFSQGNTVISASPCQAAP